MAKSKVSQAEFVRKLLARRCAVQTIADRLRKEYPQSAALKTHAVGYVNAIAKVARSR